MKLPRLNSTILKATVLSTLGATILVACNSGSGSGSRPASNQNPNVIVTPSGEIIPADAAAASQYDGAQLDPYVALNQYGTWQTIGQERYFVPSGVDAKWQPYQNGSWSFDEENERGWSFVSQDKWGWMTEHYGIWRHHNRHGWVWLPFPDRHYEASVVTWFDQGEYIGWYPYSERHTRFYINSFGFDDGFWAGGYRPVISLGFSNPNIFLGIVLVNRIDVTRPNIFRYVVPDHNLIRQVAIAAHTDERIRQGLIGPIPGGNFAKSHEFIQRYAAIKAPVGHSQVITSRGGAKIVQPFMPVGGHPGLANNVRDRGQNDNNRPQSPRADNHIRPSTPTPAAPAPAIQTPRAEQPHPAPQAQTPPVKSESHPTAITSQPPAPAPLKPVATTNGLQQRPQQSQGPQSFSRQDDSTNRRNEMHNPSMRTQSFSDDRGNRVSIMQKADDHSQASVRINGVQQPDNSNQTRTENSDPSRRGR